MGFRMLELKEKQAAIDAGKKEKKRCVRAGWSLQLICMDNGLISG